MKIKELIEKLQEYDEDMEVVIYDWEDKTYDNAFEFSKEIESYMMWKDWKPVWSRIDKELSTAKIITDKRVKQWYDVIHKDILVIYADY